MTSALLVTTLLLFAPSVDSPVSPADGPAHRAVRMVDVTGDGVLDKLYLERDGQLSLAVNVGGGVFQPIDQELPTVRVTDVHVSDLDGDGLPDLYLVSQQANVALRGDGQGYFQDVTAELGLADRGFGVSAERVDLDGMAPEELLLRNTAGDVVFWATGRAFRRDADTPDVSNPTGAHDLAAMQQLVARAAGLLALDPEEQIVIGLDETGRPRVELGPRTAGGRGAKAPVDGLSNPVQGSPETAAPTPTAGPRLGSLGAQAAAGAAGPVLTPDEKRILSHMSLVHLDDGFGNLVNETIRISGANLQIVNGLRATNGNPTDPGSIDPVLTAVNGVGNLIVGYNELSLVIGVQDRTGSHNVVIGQGHSYTSFGGFVGSSDNQISGPFASVSGGRRNDASGPFASISGGGVNTASGFAASVSGGAVNTASGNGSWVTGGTSNVASFEGASVSGGWANTASAYGSSVSGGMGNTASGTLSSVSGGVFNTASFHWSSVSGGRNNMASGEASSVSGGGFNTASGESSSVSGGNSRLAAGTDDWVAGSLFEDS